MWPRLVEIVLALWLLAGSWWLSAGPELPATRPLELFAAGAIILVALLSFHRRLRRIYLMQLVIGLWLVGYGFWISAGPAPPAVQNAMLLGAVLLMFGVIPTEANQPPRSWRRLNHSPPVG
jgi:hypothetical protein